MKTARLEAFSDGVFAIIITIMVLEIKVPHEASMHAIMELLPVFISYLLSFAFVGVYWVNHHHLLHITQRTTARIMWSNMALLFTLSLVPFTTGWMGESGYDKLPVAVYCINLFIVGLCAYLLQLAVTYKLPPEDKIFTIIKFNLKKTAITIVGNIASIVLAFFYPMISVGIIAVTFVFWMIPDPRIERVLEESDE